MFLLLLLTISIILQGYSCQNTNDLEKKLETFEREMVQRIIKLEKQVSALTDANKVLHDRVEQCDIRHKKDMSLLYGVIQNISEKDNISDPAVSKAVSLSFAESTVLKSK